KERQDWKVITGLLLIPGQWTSKSQEVTYSSSLTKAKNPNQLGTQQSCLPSTQSPGMNLPFSHPPNTLS
ncbi:hypothetical protein LEMLEM_LOCUS10150, partial [Lemmus lemmus]